MNFLMTFSNFIFIEWFEHSPTTDAAAAVSLSLLSMTEVVIGNDAHVFSPYIH